MTTPGPGWHEKNPDSPGPAWSSWNALATDAPFDFELTAAALRRRPGNRLDRFDGGVARRLIAVAVEGEKGLTETVVLEVRDRGTGFPGVAWRFGRWPTTRQDFAPEPRSTVDPAAAIGRLVRRSYGLDVQPEIVEATARSDDRLWAALQPNWSRLAGLRPPRTVSPWEAVVLAVCCQQLTLDVGLAHAARLAGLVGAVRTAGDGDALLMLPAPAVLAVADPSGLRDIGLSRAKASTLTTVARMVVDGALDLERLEREPTPVVREALLGIRGIGPWTAGNVLLRGFGRLEVFPSGDAGMARAIERALKPPGAPQSRRSFRVLAELSDRWVPARGWVYFALAWASRMLPQRDDAAI